MVGNNAQEDIEAAKTVGMDTYLITDCLISNGNIPETKKGSFSELVDFLLSLD
jgi:FMN phosphatase YigB (HAD superfamily)